MMAGASMGHEHYYYDCRRVYFTPVIVISVWGRSYLLRRKTRSLRLLKR